MLRRKTLLICGKSLTKIAQWHSARLKKLKGLIASIICLILKIYLHETKQNYLWLPHGLTEDQKTRRMKCWWETLKILGIRDKFGIRSISWQVWRYVCTVILCRPSLKTKFSSLKMSEYHRKKFRPCSLRVCTIPACKNKEEWVAFFHVWGLGTMNVL